MWFSLLFLLPILLAILIGAGWSLLHRRSIRSPMTSITAFRRFLEAMRPKGSRATGG